MVQVGIDDLNVYASTLKVLARDLAEARGFPRKSMDALELDCRSLAPSFEDPVTLAANAAKPIVEVYGKGAFDLLIVATESGVDYGKAMSSYLHRHLELKQGCRNFEIKHACYAGTAALHMACSWVRENPECKALVVLTDMARKLFGDMAEPVEGAGAVAMVVSAHPRVLAIEPSRAYVAAEVYDITRPTPLLEQGDPNLSLGAYLDLFEAAFAAYQKGAGAASLSRHFDYMIYHTPLVPLVRQAHRLFTELDGTDEDVRASFERLVAPSLAYCQKTGNLYGGSLYAALAGLIDHAPKLEPGMRVGMYSYGSGSCAELYSGIVATKEARNVVAAHRVGDGLERRRVVSVSDYEKTILDTEAAFTSRDFRPDLSILEGHYDSAYRGRGLLVLDRVEGYYRRYRWS